jgi:hypothetical protein
MNPYQPYQPPAAPPPQAIYAPTGAAMTATGHCIGCGARGETKNIVLVQNVGLIVLRFQRVLRGAFCKPCIRRHFWRMTTIMFFFGWWGIISFVFTVIGIPANIVQYVRTFSMKDPTVG